MHRFLPTMLMVLLTTSFTTSFLSAAESQTARPPQLTLSAPREVFHGQDAVFTASVEPVASGKVTFNLKTFADDTLWSKTATIEQGKASVVLDSATVGKIEKDSYVLVAGLDDKPEVVGYAGVRLRGRIFRNVIETPADIRPGDEIEITDTRLFGPADSISDTSTRGKWWRRAYRIDGRNEEQTLLCVEENDPDDPQSCMAGQLTLPLKLDGWYEIWVRTYREKPSGGTLDMRGSGGIDVRLSGEKYFLQADPLQIGTKPQKPAVKYGILVDVLYRTNDMTGQSLVFQQPYGTYESEKKKCNAAVAGVRLKKLSVAQVARLKKDRTRRDVRRIGYDNDGFSCFWKWAIHDESSIARLLEPLRDQSVEFFNISLGGLGGIIIPTPYTEIYQMHGHTRDGDDRVNAFYRWCFENDVNIVDVLARRAHEIDIKLFISLMAERCYSPDKTVRAHPEWKIKRGRGTWDYALNEVQEYQVKKISWICENHDIDGFIVDYTRYGHYFNEDDPDKFKHMNTYLRKLRKAIDEVNAKKDRKVLLCGSFGDRSWHLMHWGTGKLEDQGLDIETWLEEGIFDIIMPEGPTALNFVAMAKAKNSRTKVWPRKVRNVDFPNHKYDRKQDGPKALEHGAKGWFDRGAPGIFFFNHETMTTLGRLGFTEELALRVKVADEIYGMCDGPKVKFTSWYPSEVQREMQRLAIKPVTAAADIRKPVAIAFTFPITNKFDRPVTISASWSYPQDKKNGNASTDARPLIQPASASADIEPGKTGEFAFELKGRIAAQSDLPRAVVQFSHNGLPVFSCSVPVRAVPEMVCKRVDSPPKIDGRLNDAAWTSAGGIASTEFFDMGISKAKRPKIKMAIARDEQNLYLAYDYTGDVSNIGRDPLKRDSRAIYSNDGVQLLIDTFGDEQQYKKFAITPTGSQAEELWHYDAFAGHFIRSNKAWNAEWTAAAVIRDDGYSVEIAIPFAVLGKTPEPGDIWRMNVVSRTLVGKGIGFHSSWSSPESAFHLPRRLGVLFGTLKFQ
ncbi:MAG: hypothetical protein JXM70_03250 [Pirellulales bacterium]|nr:hypothetical protein [Pirellulales bacterium]